MSSELSVLAMFSKQFIQGKKQIKAGGEGKAEGEDGKLLFVRLIYFFLSRPEATGEH